MKHEEIHKICKKHNIENYVINSDGSIDVDGNVNLYNKHLTKLLLRFNKVSGNFECSFNKLTTLDGAPREVGGDFWCSNNKLISLQGGPEKVGGYYNCSHNKLISLKKSPHHVGIRLISHGNSVELDYDKYIKGVKRINKLGQL